MVTCTGGKEPLGSAKCKLFVLALHNQPSSLESSSLSSPSSSLFLSRWRHRMITTLMVTKLFPQSRDWGEWMMTLWCRATPPCGGSDQRLRKTSRIWHYHFLFLYYYFDMAIYRVLFLTVPPHFQYQNEKTCSANEELLNIEYFFKK